MKILKPIELSSTSTEKQIAQKCWDVFLPFMSQFPEPWLWMYRHWRYLPQQSASLMKNEGSSSCPISTK